MILRKALRRVLATMAFYECMEANKCEKLQA